MGQVQYLPAVSVPDELYRKTLSWLQEYLRLMDEFEAVCDELWIDVGGES